jgi:hypothetical protein
MCVDVIEGVQGMSAKNVLYFVSTIVAFALIASTTVLCLAADNTVQLY